MESDQSNKQVLHALRALGTLPESGGGDGVNDLLNAIRSNLFKGDYRIIAKTLGIKSTSSISDVLHGKRKSQRVLDAAYNQAIRNKLTLSEMERNIMK